MAMLVGWHGGVIGDWAPEDATKLMLDARPRARGQDRQVQTGLDFGIGTAGAARICSVAAEDTIYAAIIGRTRWLDTALAERARAKGNAAALIETYRRHGEKLFGTLGGSFALAIIDRAENLSLLAIDRVGIETLCYGTTPEGALVFASDTDGAGAHPGLVRTVSPQAVFDYLYFGISPSPGTIYRELRKLLPAQYLRRAGGRIDCGFYWQMPYAERTEKEVRDLSGDLMQRLRGALVRTVGDEDPRRLGAFLSGGLDSSTVTGLLSEASGGHAKTFTIGFRQAKYDESGYAEIVARHFQTEHRTYYLTPRDVARALVPIARAFDEPFGNSSVLPAYYCAKLAGENGVSLMLAGDGGDELFGGNSRYVDELVLDVYRLLPEWLRHRAIEPAMQLSFLEYVPLARKLRNYVHHARVHMPDRTQRHNFYATTDIRQIFASDFISAVDPAAPLQGLSEVYERTTSPALLHRMLHLDLKLTLADNDLRKVSVACDLAQMPVAFPFLDDDIVEFASCLEPSLLIRRFEKRWFFKETVRGLLPAETLAKRKHGFGMPFAEWPRQDAEIREIALDCIRGMERRNIFQTEFLTRLKAKESNPQLDGLIWDIMMLELWLRERIDNRRNESHASY